MAHSLRIPVRPPIDLGSGKRAIIPGTAKPGAKTIRSLWSTVPFERLSRGRALAFRKQDKRGGKALAEPCIARHRDHRFSDRLGLGQRFDGPNELILAPAWPACPFDEPAKPAQEFIRFC